VRFGDADVTLHVEAPADAPEEAFDRAADLLAALDCDRLKAFAAAQLFELYDDTWRHADGPQVEDEAGFAALLTPESVGVRPDEVWDESGFGSGPGATVSFEDGDLFCGHGVVVSVGADLEPFDADIG
jgi:hypothetical protein